MIRPFAVLIAALAAALSGAGAAIAQSPKISVSETFWKFGTVDQGHRETRWIDVKNEGDAPLNLKRAGVSCGCLSASVATMVVPPGGSTRLTINLDATRVVGTIAKYVFIDSDDPKRPQVTVNVEGTVVAAWTVIPTSLNFGEIDATHCPQQIFRFTVMPKKAVKLVAVRTNTPRIVLERKPFALPDGTNGIDFTVTLAPDTPKGTFYGSIVVETDSKVMPTQEVIVNARVLGTIVTHPETLALGTAKSGETRTFKIRIDKKTGDPLAVEKISCNDKTIVITQAEVVPGRTIDLTVTWTPEFGRAALGKIFIITNDPNERLLTIPYTGSVMK